MTKLYWLGIVSLSGLVWVGLDWYMTTKKLLWGAVADVWPFWLLTMAAGFMLGGAVWGVIAQAALASDGQTLNAEFEQEKTAYRQTLKNNLKDERAELIRQEQTLDKRVKLAEQALDATEQKAKDKLKAKKRAVKAAMKIAIDTQAEADRLIMETKAENESFRVRALNASKMLERIRKEHKETLAKLKPDDTEQSP